VVLPALLFSYLFIYLCTNHGLGAYLLPISLGFHLVGLLGSSYTMFVDIPFAVRDGLFFGFFYTSLGYAIYSYDWQPDTDRSTLYLGLTILFGALHIGERYVLGYVITESTVAGGRLLVELYGRNCAGCRLAVRLPPLSTRSRNVHCGTVVGTELCRRYLRCTSARVIRSPERS